jgi:hypothetical protein
MNFEFAGLRCALAKPVDGILWSASQGHFSSRKWVSEPVFNVVLQLSHVIAAWPMNGLGPLELGFHVNWRAVVCVHARIWNFPGRRGVDYKIHFCQTHSHVEGHEQWALTCSWLDDVIVGERCQETDSHIDRRRCNRLHSAHEGLYCTIERQ